MGLYRITQKGRDLGDTTYIGQVESTNTGFIAKNTKGDVCGVMPTLPAAVKELVVCHTNEFNETLIEKV